MGTSKHRKGFQILNNQKEEQMFTLPSNQPKEGGLFQPLALLHGGDKIMASKKTNMAHDLEGTEACL